MFLKKNKIDILPKQNAIANNVLLIVLITISTTSGVLASSLTVKVTDKAGIAIENAVVYVEPTNKISVLKTPIATATIEQKGRKFSPLVTVVQTGSNISFPNHDTVRHHVYSFSPAKTFELKLYAGVPTAPVVFNKPGTAILGCNIHDQMLAFVHIVDTPYFAKTDNTGNAVLKDVPNGAYALKAWHYALAEENKVVEKTMQLNGDQQAELALELKPLLLPK